MKNVLYIAIGGAVGAVLRYAMSKWITVDSTFPWATFVVNIVGCLLIGFLLGLLSKDIISPEMKMLLVTGFCGGFTTFSTFAYESYSLIKSSELLSVAIYLTLSLWLGITAVWLGEKLSLLLR